MSVNLDAKVDAPEPDAATRARPLALVAVALAALLAVIDGTVVAVALEPLSAALGSPLTTIVWTTIVYLLAAATMLPMLGWATARFGARRVFLTGLALFVLGSTLCACAWSAGALLTFRAVQGFGGGLLEPTALMLAAGMADRRNVGRVLGTLSMIINVAPILGPVLGGLLLETGHWQWLFIVNVPFGLVVAAMTFAFVPAAPPDPDDRTVADVRGLALLTIGYVGVLFALNRLGQSGGRWAVLAGAVVGVVLLAGYVRHALRLERPAFDLRLLRRPQFAGALAVMGFVGVIMYSQLTALPLFAQAAHGLHGIGQGLVVTALGAGMIVSMTLGGRISDRTGPRPLVRRGAAASAVGLAVFAALNDELPLPATLALFVAIGLSFGWVAAPTFASVYRLLPPAEQPAGTTALFMTVQLTASLGVTLLGLLQHSVPGDWLTVLFAIAAGGALVQSLLSRLLPGAPDPAPTR